MEGGRACLGAQRKDRLDRSQVRLRTPYCAALAVPVFAYLKLKSQWPKAYFPFPGAHREMNQRFTNVRARQPERSGGAAVIS